jgi:hypothetical protein
MSREGCQKLSSIIGHVKEHDSAWYALKTGKIVSVHITNKGKMFMSDSETWPSVTAARLGIKYTLLVNATDVEARYFFKEEGIELA